MTVFDQGAAAGRANRINWHGFEQSERAPTAAQSFHAALALHRQGRLREAERLYRSVLTVRQSDFDCLHNLGLLHAQEGRFDEAVGFLRAVARQDPRSVEVHNNLANVLALLRRHDEAVAGFRVAITLKPDFAEAHNNLGNALAAQGRAEEAIAHYAQALRLRPDYADARLNLGKVLYDLGRLDDAAGHYRQALAGYPRSAEIHCRLGNTLRKQGRLAEAAACYQRSVALDPAGAEAHCELGSVQLEQREFATAQACFERATQLKPDLAQAWLGLGHVLHQARRYADAIAAFGRAPGLADAWLGQARALVRLKRPEEAIAAYRQALAKGGDADIIRYYLASLGAEPAPLAAPRRLVGSVFDRYSDHYDRHLVETLKYRTPGLLFDAVRRLAPSGGLDVLDLGCGTGLSGMQFRPLARTIAGVDISPRMLAVARQRHIYDDLTCGELVEILQAQSRRFDLVVAADVLVYFGDLAPVFQEVASTLGEGGIFAFSAEAGEGRDFTLKPTSRYAHSAAYLGTLARAHGFVLESIATEVLRQEEGGDVVGHIAVLRSVRT